MENIKEKLYLFHQGTYYHAYEILGAHPASLNGKLGYVFRTWAPNAIRISVMGDFNGWNNNAHVMKKLSDGVWEVFVEGAVAGQMYKYEITDKNNYARLKADPYAFHSETPGTTSHNASKLYDLSGSSWTDKAYWDKRKHTNIYSAPMNIYELNLLSW